MREGASTWSYNKQTRACVKMQNHVKRGDIHWALTTSSYVPVGSGNASIRSLKQKGPVFPAPLELSTPSVKRISRFHLAICAIPTKFRDVFFDR